jgi:hypothetical protein
MCCLGFYAKAKGFTDDEIEDMTDFSDLGHNAETKARVKAAVPDMVNTECGAFHATTLENDIMKNNDFRSLTDVEREKYLTEKFASLGVELEFVN